VGHFPLPFVFAMAPKILLCHQLLIASQKLPFSFRLRNEECDMIDLPVKLMSFGYRRPIAAKYGGYFLACQDFVLRPGILTKSGLKGSLRLCTRVYG
jgi:hypothetical protein